MGLTLFCDSCGGNIKETGSDGNRGLHITMRFFSWWTKNGDAREIYLCARCGFQAMQLLGFQYDTGKILSIARKELIDGVSVFGSNGGGLLDIAIGGVAGANPAEWHAGIPDAPSAGAMVRRDE